MAASWNDGTMVYGSTTLSINSVTYIAENVTITRGTTVIEQRNENNEPSKSVGVPDWVKGNGTLQCAAAATAEPLPGLTFSKNWGGGTGTENFIVTECGRALSQGEAVKFSVSFIKAYN
jgi:hypothetical protein